MAKAGYSIRTTAAVALSAATAKTVLCVITPAQFGIDLKKVRVGFDGVTASAVPVLCELMTSTLATNSTPGTGNTTGTVIATSLATLAAATWAAFISGVPLDAAFMLSSSLICSNVSVTCPSPSFFAMSPHRKAACIASA